MKYKHLDMTSILTGNTLTVLWDGMRDGRSYQVPLDRVRDARLVLRREAPLSVNQLVDWLEYHNHRVK